MSPELRKTFMEYHEHQIARFSAALRKTRDWNESARLNYLIDYHEDALNRIGREAQSADRRSA